MRNPVILRIVTILDLVSLSILDLLEYGMSAKDINYAMANGVIQFAEIPKMNSACPNRPSKYVSDAKLNMRMILDIQFVIIV
jgi:hypothetical protein